MILYEFEGKKLLAEAGIDIPKSQLIDSSDLDPSPSTSLRIRMTGGVVLKAQVLSGKRAEAGGIITIDNGQLTIDNLKKLFGKTINKERVEKVLMEERVDFEAEYYLSLSYDTEERGPVLTISVSGGTGVEDLPAGRQEEIINFPIDPIKKTIDYTQIKDFGLPEELISKLIKLFFEQDLLLLEINPLVKISDSPSTTLRTVAKSDWIALDAKIKLDDTASGRHKEDWAFPPRAVPGHTPTQAELEAKKIDEEDYRGTAGSTYFDLDGDIAILASGGGASLTAMDALLRAGGRPANYTEYSGNPPKEKVEKLTKIVLSKPNLNGLWIVGALANFTDIYETLSGFMEGLRLAQAQLNTKFSFPIVIRRAGPNDKKAFEMLKKQVKDFDLHLYGEEISITQSAKIIADLAKKYVTSS